MAVARLPVVVVLHYPRRIRFVVIDTGGCPEIVLGTGERRYLLFSAADVVLSTTTPRSRGIDGFTPS